VLRRGIGEDNQRVDVEAELFPKKAFQSKSWHRSFAWDLEEKIWRAGLRVPVFLAAARLASRACSWMTTKPDTITTTRAIHLEQ
jgi:hypothetical protein